MSKTAGRIALKFGVWLDTCKIVVLQKSRVGYPVSLKKYPAPRHPGDPGPTTVCHPQFWCPGRSTAIVGFRPGHLAEWGTGSVAKARFAGHLFVSQIFVSYVFKRDKEKI